MTIIGGGPAGTTIDLQFQNGAQIRRNAQQDIFNSIITGYPNGIYIDNASETRVPYPTQPTTCFK